MGPEKWTSRRGVSDGANQNWSCPADLVCAGKEFARASLGDFSGLMWGNGCDERGAHMMGDEFSTTDPPTLKVKLRGTPKFAKVTIIRDGKLMYLNSPHAQEV